MEPAKPVEVKVVLIGNDGVGKTTLTQAYKEGKTPKGDIPIIGTNFAKDEIVEDKKVRIVVWDSACGEEYKDLRPRAYPGTDFFIFCFALDNDKSIKDVAKVWLPELEEFLPNKSVVLVGLKNDVKSVSDQSISDLRKVMKARLYFECSSKTFSGVASIFQTIAKAVVHPESYPVLDLEATQPMPTGPKKEIAQSAVCLLI